MDNLRWLIEIGSNEAVSAFLTKNSLIIAGITTAAVWVYRTIKAVIDGRRLKKRMREATSGSVGV